MQLNRTFGRIWITSAILWSACSSTHSATPGADGQSESPGVGVPRGVGSTQVGVGDTHAGPGTARAGSGAAGQSAAGATASGGRAAATGSAGRAASAGSAAAIAGHGAVPAECLASLSDTRWCEATYDAQVAATQCTTAYRTYLSQCENRRVVSWNVIDVAQSCVYDDKTGALVGTRACSKPIGNCNCFYAGEIYMNTCKEIGALDACESDAGTN